MKRWPPRFIILIKKCINNENNFNEVLYILKNKGNDKLKINNSDDEIGELLDLTYNSASSFFLLKLLFPNLSYDNSKYQVDHIFPKSKYTKNYVQKKKINSLPNLQLLISNKNNMKGDMEPKEWFDRKDSSTKENLIKDGLLTCNHLDNFDEFYKERKELLKEKILEIIVEN